MDDSQTVVAHWEPRFASLLAELWSGGGGVSDGAHDLDHVQRVVANARRLALAEGAQLAIVLPAAWLHDCVIVPKNSPQRSQASRLAATAAVRLLSDRGYPEQYLGAIGHAIAAHSFSAGIAPRTLEAQVVQDADRLDSIGAVGVARCISVGALLGRPLYAADEPRADRRVADDARSSVDHFYTKLFKLEATMHTAAARYEAAQRSAFMRGYLEQLYSEIGWSEAG